MGGNREPRAAYPPGPEQRKALAARRAREAGEREKRLAERERKADERQRAAHQRQNLLAEQTRLLGLGSGSAQLHIWATIERSRASLAAGRPADDSQQVPDRRSAARGKGQAGSTDLAGNQTPARGLGETLERANTLRREVVAAIAAVAVTEEETARLYDDLAARRPDRAEHYRGIADAARAGARRAHELVHKSLAGIVTTPLPASAAAGSPPPTTAPGAAPPEPSSSH